MIASIDTPVPEVYSLPEFVGFRQADVAVIRLREYGTIMRHPQFVWRGFCVIFYVKVKHATKSGLRLAGEINPIKIKFWR